MAARASQRAAAFVRFQILGDHEAMSLLLTGIQDDERIAFMAALGSVAGSLAVRAFGEDGARDYLETLARASAAVEVDE